jgi:hypothetical protein
VLNYVLLHETVGTMKLSIAIEMIGENLQSDWVALHDTKDELRQNNPGSFRISANFIAQLAATFLQDDDDRTHQRPGAIQHYEIASVPTSFPPGTVMCRKI